MGKRVLAVFSVTPIARSLTMVSEGGNFRLALYNPVENSKRKLLQIFPIDSFWPHAFPRRRPSFYQLHLPLELSNELRTKSRTSFFVEGYRIKIFRLGLRKKSIAQRNKARAFLATSSPEIA